MAEFEDNNPFAGSDRSDFSDDLNHLNISNEYNSESIYGPDKHDAAAYNPSATDSPYSQDHESPVITRTYSSRIEQILYETKGLTIQIIDAGKTHEGNSRGFIAYTIKIMDLTVRRRYSEFESLRTTLTKLFPTLIIPPIPEKHSMCK